MNSRHPKHKVTRVLIGIQARSTSTRFPNKAAAMVGTKSMLDRVVSAAEESAKFLSRGNFRDPVETTIALLVPTDDALVRAYAGRCVIVEGSEQDVLARFRRAYEQFYPDYICRITGDCPMLPDFVISKHIRTAIQGCWDYVTNVDPRFRTEVDGYDCEVVSRHLMKWVFDNAKSDHDKEHVTTLIRSKTPEWARVCNLIGYVDRSGIKLSVDTPDDLERVREEIDKVDRKLQHAREYRVNSVVYRF